MKNWSVDTRYLSKFPEKYKIWQLEQLINYGMENKKIDKKDLIKYWDEIKNNIDPYKKRFLEYLLWKKVYSLKDNLNFWNFSAKIKK